MERISFPVILQIRLRARSDLAPADVVVTAGDFDRARWHNIGHDVVMIPS